MRTLFVSFAALVVFQLSGCGGCGGKSKSSRSEDETAPVAEAPPPGIVAVATEPEAAVDDPTALYGLNDTLPVAGYVTADVNGVDSETAGTLAVDVALTLVDDACTSGTFTAKLVGSGYELAKDVAYAASRFDLPKAPRKHEVVIELACGQRCLVQSGQKGVLCNKIADGVLGAFEVVLAKDLYNKSFLGAKIAKVAASIVDSAQLNGDDTAEFKRAITACDAQTDLTVKRTCYSEAIKNSPFYSAFKIMQQLSIGWTPEGLYSFVTSVLGAKVDVDSELYTPIMDGVEKALGNTFVTETRALLADAVKAQNANQSKYSFQVSCSLDIVGEATRFKPDVDAADQLTCNAEQAATILSAAGIAVQYHAEILKGKMRDPVPCTHEKAHEDMQGNKQCWASLNMQISGVADERDRNDFDGTRRTYHERSLSMVETMPQVHIALSQAGINVGGDGPMAAMSPEEQAKFDAALVQAKDYFLGVVGMYRILNDPSVRDLKLSLNDLHTIFNETRFMNTRLQTFGRPGLSGVMYPGDGGPRHMQPLLRPDPTGQFLTVDDAFIYDPMVGYTQTTITAEKAVSLLQEAELPFAFTMGMFEKVPTTREAERFIFDASRHEEWNPVGSRYLFVAQLKSTKTPIACKLVNPGPGLSMIAGSSIVCDETGAGVACSATDEGACTFPAGYEYPFVLSERGWFGDDQGRMFSLTSRMNGRPVGGRDGVMIRETKAGNAEGQCRPGQEGQVVQYITRFHCGQETMCQQNVTAYCMDMAALGAPARKRFYPGGFHNVSFFDDRTGETHSWDVPRIGVHTPATDHATDTSACLFVPTGTYYTSGSSSLVTTNMDGSGYLSAPGGAIKDCGTSAAAGEEKFILFQWRDFDGSDAMYAFLLNGSNQTLMKTMSPPAPGVPHEENYARLKQADFEALLTGGKTTAGAAATQINGMKYVNPAHDPKFDPYCDDVDGNGACDCFPLASLSADGLSATFGTTVRSNPSECGLRDKAAEPTISQLPYCAECPGSARSVEFFTQFGGKSGADLAGASTFFGAGQQPMFDMMSAAFCKHRFEGEVKARSPRWINMQDWGGNHDGCPASEGVAKTTNAQGPVRLLNPKPMRNAFLIGRPRQLLQLVSYAFKSVGQGVVLGRDDKVFAMDEAMALLRLRAVFPPDDLKVQVGGVEVKGLPTLYEHMETPGDHSGPLSRAMKGVLFKGGKLTEADLSVERPEGAH